MYSVQLKLFAHMLHMYGLLSMCVIQCSEGIRLANALSTDVAVVGLAVRMFYQVHCELFPTSESKVARQAGIITIPSVILHVDQQTFGLTDNVEAEVVQEILKD